MGGWGQEWEHSCSSEPMWHFPRPCPATRLMSPPLDELPRTHICETPSGPPWCLLNDVHLSSGRSRCPGGCRPNGRLQVGFLTLYPLPRSRVATPRNAAGAWWAGDLGQGSPAGATRHPPDLQGCNLSEEACHCKHSSCLGRCLVCCKSITFFFCNPMKPWIC